MAPKGKKDMRKEREAERAMSRDLEDESQSASLARLAAGLSMKPAIDNGVEQLVEKKLTKEEKKELAAQKKAEREAKKAAAAAESAACAPEADGEGVEYGDNYDAEGAKKPAAKAKAAKAKPETKAERVLREQAELDIELELARVNAVKCRNLEGAYLGQIEAPTFSLSNPGGGPDLLERAGYTLQRGRSYGLVGRNGCGKSTLLKAMASRRVGCIPPNVTVHYVSQEVSLTEQTLAMTPTDVVINADVERRLLLEERDALIAAEASGDAIDLYNPLYNPLYNSPCTPFHSPAECTVMIICMQARGEAIDGERLQESPPLISPEIACSRLASDPPLTSTDLH